MKKIILIALYLFGLTVYSQNPTPFDNSIRVKNLATQSGTPDIAVFDNNKVLKRIAWSSLPSGSSSVLEYANFAAFPGTGTVEKIYVDKATNIIYRWSGSAYVILSPFTTPTLDQVMETGRLYTQTIGNKNYTFGFNPPFPFNSVDFATIVKNNTTDTFGSSIVSDTAVGMGITENPANFNRYTSNDQNLEEGHSIRTWDNRTDEQFLNELKIPFKTSGSGHSLFSIPNNKPAGEYTLATTEDIETSIAPLQTNSTDQTVWNNGKSNVSSNTSFGEKALKSNTTGADNTAFGKDALENNTTGNENVAIGGSALPFNTTGSGNTAIGRLAGMSLTGFNTSPTNSIFIGRNAYALAANQNNQIVIGENTTGAGSNTVTLGNSSITTTRLRGTVQGNSFVKDGGTSSQILMADGSVATAGSGISIASGTISASGSSATWGGITGTLSSQTDLQNALALKANLASPTFTGTVSAPTPTANDNSTKVATTAYADAKVQNSLTASTSVAPSATAVNNELNKTRRLIVANSASSVTGTTAETIISSLLIPANSFDSFCDIWTTFTYRKNTANALPIRLYYNTTNSLSGATQLALFTSGSPQNGMLNRKYLLNGTGLDLLTSAPTTSLYNNETVDAIFAASTVITIAPTSDIFFIWTVQNDIVGTTFNHKRSTVEKLKLN